MGKFAVSIEHSEAKSVSASGGHPEFFLCPLQSADFDQGFASVRVRIE